MTEQREPEFFQLKKNDILIRTNAERTQFNLVYAVDDRIQSYVTRSFKGALIIAECIYEGKEIPSDLDDKPNG